MSEQPAIAEKYIIMPFKKNRRNLVATETRAASSEAAAMRIAESMSARYIGVAAYAVQVDTESGDMSDPRLLVSFGEIPDMDD